MRQNQRDSFRALADDTGGKAFYGNNNIEGAIQSAFEDDRYTYIVGFYPNHGAWDGKFREIKILLSRSGSRLRYRRGYFAFPEHMEKEAIMKADLQEAAGVHGCYRSRPDCERQDFGVFFDAPAPTADES